MIGSLLFSLLLSWVQVSSDTYIVKSSAGEERAKRVLKELEDFHQLVGSTLAAPATCHHMLVFPNGQSPSRRTLALLYVPAIAFMAGKKKSVT